MKITGLLFFMMLISVCTYGQIFHIHFNNNDVETRAKLNELITTLGSREALLIKSNRQLKKAIDHHKMQLQKNYTTNRYDKRDNFVAASIGSTALSLGTSVMSNFKQLPYVSKSKREYFNQLAMDKAVLLALQYVSASQIKSANRQQIYRLRSEMIHLLSKNDRESRSLLTNAMIGLFITNPDMFEELRNMFENTEIVL